MFSRCDCLKRRCIVIVYSCATSCLTTPSVGRRGKQQPYPYINNNGQCSTCVRIVVDFSSSPSMESGKCESSSPSQTLSTTIDWMAANGLQRPESTRAICFRSMYSIWWATDDECKFGIRQPSAAAVEVNIHQFHFDIDICANSKWKEYKKIKRNIRSMSWVYCEIKYPWMPYRKSYRQIVCWFQQQPACTKCAWWTLYDLVDTGCMWMWMIFYWNEYYRWGDHCCLFVSILCCIHHCCQPSRKQQ